MSGIRRKILLFKLIAGSCITLFAMGSVNSQEVEGGTLYGDMLTVTQDMLDRATSLA